AFCKFLRDTGTSAPTSAAGAAAPASAAAAAPASAAAAAPAGDGDQGATLQSIAVTPDSPSLASGATQQLSATGTYDDNCTQDLSGAGSWSSSDSSVVTVDNNGQLTAGANAGSATVTATDSNTNITGSTDVTVTAATPTLQSIAVTPDSPSLAGGATQQL